MIKYIPALKKSIPELIFVIYSIRLISVGASIGDAIALISLVAIYGFMRFMDRQQVEQYNELKEEIENLKNNIQSVKLSVGLRKQNEPQAPSNGIKKRYF